MSWVKKHVNIVELLSMGLCFVQTIVLPLRFSHSSIIVCNNNNDNNNGYLERLTRTCPKRLHIL